MSRIDYLQLTNLVDRDAFRTINHDGLVCDPLMEDIIDAGEQSILRP